MIASIWGKNMLRDIVIGYHLLLVDHSFPQATVVRSRKTVRFSKQIMFADKYPSIFSCQMEAIVYLFTFVRNDRMYCMTNVIKFHVFFSYSLTENM